MDAEVSTAEGIIGRPCVHLALHLFNKERAHLWGYVRARGLV